MKKNVLILTNLCHSSPRIPGLIKYLPEQGWNTHVLAPELPQNHHLDFGPNSDFDQQRDRCTFIGQVNARTESSSGRAQTKNKLAEQHPLLFHIARKLFLYYKEWHDFPDDHAKWMALALPAARKLLKTGSFDLILSSSSPVSMHLLAHQLNQEFNIPWVADLRDLWTQNHDYPYSNYRKKREQRIELEALKTANALVSVSEPCCSELASLHQNIHIASIMNGFDPESAKFDAPTLTDPIHIVYTGNIYYKKQNPDFFLEALSNLLRSQKIPQDRFRVDFYGPPQGWLQSLINKWDLNSIVHQNEILSREESFSKQRSAQLLLMFNWESYEDSGVRPLKMFEYLAAGRPILATGGSQKDGVRNIFTKTKAGTYCQTTEEIEATLLQANKEYEQNRAITYHGIKSEIEQFDYKNMARKFATEMNAVI